MLVIDIKRRVQALFLVHRGVRAAGRRDLGVADDQVLADLLFQLLLALQLEGLHEFLVEERYRDLVGLGGSLALLYTLIVLDDKNRHLEILIQQILNSTKVLLLVVEAMELQFSEYFAEVLKQPEEEDQEKQDHLLEILYLGVILYLEVVNFEKNEDDQKVQVSPVEGLQADQHKDKDLDLDDLHLDLHLSKVYHQEAVGKYKKEDDNREDQIRRLVEVLLQKRKHDCHRQNANADH